MQSPQKVGALAGRREVQARDVFDLGAVLIPRTGGKALPLEVDGAVLKAAMERAMALEFRDYKSQVVAFLHPDHRPALDSPDAWDSIQLEVVEYLDQALAGGRGPGR